MLNQSNEIAHAIIQSDMAEIATQLRFDSSRLAGKTLLITGASGMLPSYMADFVAYANDQHLLECPARLVLLVRSAVQTGGRLGHLLGRDDVRFVVQDVTQQVSIDEPLHFIVHAASAASPRWYRQDPIGTASANSVGLTNILELARKHDVESVLFFSSSEVYGQPEMIPTPETSGGQSDFLTGRACYSESKRFGETLCACYHEQYGLPVKIVRPFHVHGPGLRLDDGRIVADMVALGLGQQPFALLSDGRATRTYGYISDATVGFFKVLFSEYNGQAFNVGADTPETSIFALASVISKLFGRTEPVQVNNNTPPEHVKGAPARACPDLTKIRQLLGYAPIVSLEDGLGRTIQWHKAIQDIHQ